MIQKERITEFWKTVDRTAGDQGCWPWLGWKDESGRGRFKLNGKTITAPRAALILERGLPNPDLHACHSCDNPGCCNPAHLRWGSRNENMREMGRKGRAGIQRHPDKYKRERKPGTRYRPVKQPNADPGIDHRTATRYATPQEIEIAQQALLDLERHQNRIVLVPAPDPHFEGHKIRVVESRNPTWYIEFGNQFWKGERRFDLKRCRVVRGLERVVKGRVRGNGYERQVLEWLKEHPELIGID